MATAIKANYGCAQKDLYTGLRLLWINYLADRLAFFGYKNKYVVALATAANLAIDAAEGMPDDASRDAAAETLKPEVKSNADTVIDDFKKTEGYIDELYSDAEVRHAQYVLAGYNYFDGAGHYDWESVKQLGVKNSAYVTANATALEMGGLNMPAGFPADVTTHEGAFELKYGQYLAAGETATATGNKLTANNACMTTGRGLMKDAVKGVYPRNLEQQDRYNWDKIQARINPAVAGMDGYIKDAVTSVAIEGASISMKMEGKPAIVVNSDADGKYANTGIEAGTYDYIITKAGYVTITGTIEITVRNVSRRNFNMVAV